KFNVVFEFCKVICSLLNYSYTNKIKLNLAIFLRVVFMPRKLFEKEKNLQVHLTKWAHQGVFSWWLIFGKFEGSKVLLKKKIGINTYVLKDFETSETSFFLSLYYIETIKFYIFM